MTFTITPGWWLVPLLLTAIFCFLAYRAQDRDGPNYYGGRSVLNLLLWTMAIIPSLIVWVIYLAVSLWFEARR